MRLSKQFFELDFSLGDMSTNNKELDIINM